MTFKYVKVSGNVVHVLKEPTQPRIWLGRVLDHLVYTVLLPRKFGPDDP